MTRRDLPGADRWKRIEEILGTALELRPAEVDPFLQRECGDDPTLRREVEGLLQAEASCGDFLSVAAAERVAPLVREAERQEARRQTPRNGSRVGAYRLLREIGRGGMGIVFLAERVDGQFEARVCLKLLRGELDSEEILRRFLQERQILAWLRHPNIASLLDGGLTEDGVPYFVMEYVDGLPITQFCDERRMSVGDRLRLFRQVCRGVQHAHGNLVVHRDLKPSNILVTRSGEVKLLDFGIAKLLGKGPDASVTQTAVRLLTPRYAAPEQIEGGPVTTATDVYSLGVVLYELLTGHLPHDPPGNGREAFSSEAYARAVRGIEPARPSSVVLRVASRSGPGGSAAGRTPLEISRARATQPKKLRRSLSGDLDNILLQALRPAAEDRYSGAAALEEDISRHLSALPVRARPPAFSYRAARFMRRHWVAVTAAGLIVLSLLGGLAGVLWQARRAGLEARRAEAVTRFMTSLFDAATPSAAQGRTISIPRMLDSASERIDGELRDQPEVQQEVLQIVGKLYLYNGLYARAESLLARSLALGEDLYGESDPRLLESLFRLATVHQETGDLETAERDFRRALAIARTALPRDNPELTYRINDLAVLLHQKGEFAEAVRLQREVLTRKQALLGKDHPDVSSTMNNLAVLLMERGDYSEAEGLVRRALEIRRGYYGEKSTAVANTLHNLMVLHRYRREYAPAESLAREVLQLRQTLLGDRHPAVASSIFNLGAVLQGKGEREQAEGLYGRAIAMMDSTLGPDHPDVAGMRNVLARLFREEGRLAEAESISREALAVTERRLPREHPYRARILLELGQNLCDQGRFREAEELLREGHELLLRLYGPGTIPAAESGLALGSCLTHLGRFAASETELQAAAAVYRERLGEEHEETVRARAALSALAEERREKSGYGTREGAVAEAGPSMKDTASAP